MKPDHLLFGLSLQGCLFLFLFGFLTGCTEKHPGETVYQKHCSQCHGLSGKGFKKLYPPLDRSPYLSARLNELPCLIVYGSRDWGKTENPRSSRIMPPIKSVSRAELPTLLEFLQKRWSAQNIQINQSKLETWLSSCKT